MNESKEFVDMYYGKLDKKYWPQHNYCCFLIESIRSFIYEIKENNLDETEITFDIEPENFSDEECCLSFLKNNNMEKEFVSVICKNLFLGLIFDFLEYIDEVIFNLKIGKISIAYELMRKPFKENLLYMELILFDCNNIANCIYDEEVNKYSIGRDGLSRKEIKEIVKFNTINNRMFQKFTNGRISNDEIYNIRYSYDSSNSLELVWNKAIHLITTSKNIKSKDFNFIYKGIVDWDEHLSYIYGKLPLLLLYTLGITEKIFERFFRDIKPETKFYNDYLLLENLLESHNKYDSKSPFSNLIKDRTYFPCTKCNSIIKIDADKKYYYNYIWTICPKCNQLIDVHKYYFIKK